MTLENSIIQEFGDLEDFRIERNRIHPLINIVTIAILGVICGADTWVDIERYGQAKAGWLGEFLDLTWYSVSRHLWSYLSLVGRGRISGLFRGLDSAYLCGNGWASGCVRWQEIKTER